MNRRRDLVFPLFGMALLGACATPEETSPAPEPRADVFDAYVAHAGPAGRPALQFLSGPPAGATAEAAAKSTLAALSRRYGLGAAALGAAELRAVHDTGEGPIVAQFRQRHGGIDVFRAEVSIALDRTLAPVAASGDLSPALPPRGAEFGRDAAGAIAAAYQAMTGAALPGAAGPARPDGDEAAGYVSHALPGNPSLGLLGGEARAKKVWFPGEKGLVPAWYVELDLPRADAPDSRLESFVATPAGKVLFRRDLTASDAYSYRVWADRGGRAAPWDSPFGTDFTPHPTGLRDGSKPTPVLSQLVRLQNVPFSKNDPWLSPTATEASGNNVRAYADLVAPDGYSAGDLNLVPTSPKTFDYPYDPLVAPTVSPWARRAVLTQFFYTVNYLHDTFYDAGWDEKSFNPQLDNYGRGGVAGDAIRGEAQDYSGRNNANASTPADGRSPRIQMYLWDNIDSRSDVLAPPALAGALKANGAAFGPAEFDVTADAAVARDAGGMAMSDVDLCEPVDNVAEVRGKIALIARGNCPFVQKVLNAQDAGATAVVITNNAAGLPPTQGGAPPRAITIPSIGISQADGDRLRASILAGTAARLHLLVRRLPDSDSSLDATILAHEWGHVLSNRLVGNAAGLSTLQAGGMGEGWSDFVALLTIVRPEDADAPAGATWAGVYPVGAASFQSEDRFYDGIRRYPYSTDMSKNPLTFKHVQNGVALPASPAPAFGQDGGNNAAVHNTGEVWASFLWECYAGLLRERRQPFATVNRRMRNYLVAGLKLTPSAPTILEARDALLSAIWAGGDRKDFDICWRGLARRGAGVGATGPAAGSPDNGPVAESFLLGNDVAFLGAEIDDAVGGAGRCDGDGVLDGGETDKLRLRLRNTGSGVLKDTEITVRADTPAVTFPGGNRVKVAAISPFSTGAAALDVRLAPAAAIVPYTLTITITDPDLARPRIITQQVRRLGNYDVVAASSATDQVVSQATPWTTGGDATLDESERWRIEFDGDEGRWHGGDAGAESDQYVVSPVLQVTGELNLSFRHHYSFEQSDANYDGGVIELSQDGGATWTDIGDKITANGYGADAIDPGNAVLGGRKGFVGANAGYPADVTTTVALGMGYVGKTVQVRFRVGSDGAVGAPGWDVDDIAVTGISNTPFPARVVHRGLCRPSARAEVGAATTALGSGEPGAVALGSGEPGAAFSRQAAGCQVAAGGGGAGGLLGLLGLLGLRRRRRRAA